jgi:hypothetical protein
VQRLLVYNVLIDIATIDKVALGPFGEKNEQSFWVALVEGKKLHHLGFRKADASAVRNSLALGEILFRGGPGGMAQFLFIESKTREFLTSGRLKRIYFDITNMNTLSGAVGEGRFAFIELKLILDSDALFRITSFYKDGKYIRTKRTKMRKRITKLLEGKV